jgi:hypothetical protein
MQAIGNVTITTTDGTGATSTSLKHTTFTDLWDTITWNPCEPLLSIPTKMFSLNAAYETCVPGVHALFDPPYSLTQGNGIQEPGAATTARQVAITAAQAGSTAVPATATATSDPVVETSVVEVDPISVTTAAADPATSDPATYFNTSPVIQDPAPTTTLEQAPTTTQPDPTVGVSSAAGDSQAADPSTTTTVPVGATATTGNSQDVVFGSGTTAQTLQPGGSAITVSGATVSLLPGGSSIVIGSSTQPVTAILPASTTAPAVVIGTGSAAQTIQPGQVITVSGTPISLAAGGSSVVIAGTTQAVGSSLVIAGSTQALSVVQTPAAAFEVVFGTGSSAQTLKAGAQAITVSGTMISLVAGGLLVVVDGTTKPVSAVSGAYSTEAALVLGTGSVAQTLKPGGSAITVSGTVISLLVGGSSAVVGGKTVAASVLVAQGAKATVVTEAVTTGLGGIIASLGGFTSTGTKVETKTGVTNAGQSTATSQAGFNGTVFTGVGLGRSEAWMGLWGTSTLMGICIMGMIIL